MLVSKIDASVRLYVSYSCWPSPVGLVAWTPGRRPTGVLAIAMGRNFLRVPERAFLPLRSYIRGWQLPLYK